LVIAVEQRVLLQNHNYLEIKPLLETAWFRVGLPAALAFAILSGTYSVMVFQSQEDRTLFLYMGLFSLLPLLALTLFLLFRNKGIIADSQGLTLWNIWQPSKQRHMSWSKIYALDIRRIRSYNSYGTMANLEVQESGMRLVVPCPYNLDLFRAVVSHAQLVAREIPNDWQAQTRRGKDPFKVLNRMSRSMWAGELRWYWTRRDPEPPFYDEETSSEQHGAASQPAEDRVDAKPAAKTSQFSMGYLVIIILVASSIVCTVGAYWEQVTNWAFVFAIGLLILFSLPILFLPLLLYGGKAVINDEELILNSTWSPSKPSPIAWSEICGLEIRSAGGMLFVANTELTIRSNRFKFSIRCPYDLPLLREIVSRASLVLEVAPDNWQAWAKGTNDPFVALAQRRSPKQRWYWNRRDPDPDLDAGRPRIMPSIRVEPERLDFGALAPETRYSVHRPVTVLNTSEVDARCCVIGAPWWLRVRPKIFTLAPGAQQTVEFAVDVDQVRGRKHRIMVPFALDEGWHQEVEVHLEVERRGLFGWWQ
jgi:hypothetical protein